MKMCFVQNYEGFMLMKFMNREIHIFLSFLPREQHLLNSETVTFTFKVEYASLGIRELYYFFHVLYAIVFETTAEAQFPSYFTIGVCGGGE